MRLPQQEQALKAEIDDSEEVWVRTLREREQQVVENCIKRDGIVLVIGFFPTQIRSILLLFSASRVRPEHFQSQITPLFCFKISDPDLQKGQSRIPKNLLVTLEVDDNVPGMLTSGD